ncbi:MAG: hypothetical protein IJQ01_08555, partial [Selenomonadaceae bacterium]|nr:hypothetical protein [Selenomonadaceae bacterium]
MKKILLAAMLIIGVVASQLVGMPQASAELVYTGYEAQEVVVFPDENKWRKLTLRYYIIPDGIKGVSMFSDHVYGFKVPLVAKSVDYPYQKDLSHSYDYRNGQWLSAGHPAKVTSDGKFHDGSNYPAGSFDALDKAVWQTVQPYCQDLKKSIEANLGKGTGSSSSGSAPIGNLPDATKLAELKQAAEPFVTQADEKFKAKDYTAAKELFSQAIEKNPYDYHSHDLYARALYREKTKDKNYDLILSEAKKALE